MIYSTEKTLKEMRDKLDASTKEEINQAISTLKKAMEGDSSDEIKRCSEELTRASYKLAETMYARASQQRQGQAGNTGTRSSDKTSTDEEVVDADFEEVQNY